MSITDIILRIVNFLPLSTKGSELTSTEVDNNFIAIFNAVTLLENPLLITPFDNGFTYKGGVAVLVAFDAKLWKFVSDDDQQGILPGTDSEIWLQQSLSTIAHEPDTDIALDLGGPDEITAGDIRDFIDNNVESVTRAGIVALKDAETLKPGKTYFITDRDVFVKALKTDAVSLYGALLARNPDFQNVKGSNIGVWTPTIDAGSPGLNIDDITIFNGKQFKSLTGVLGGSPPLPPDEDPTNWITLASTDNSFVNEIDMILYDLDADLIIQRTDSRENVVTTNSDFVNSTSPALNPIDVFQWGNDQVIGNKVKTNSILTNLNNLQEVRYNELTDAAIVAEMQTNNFNRNVLVGVIQDVSASAVDIEGTFDVSGITVDPINADTINEKTAGAGVTVDGVLLKDGGITLSAGVAVNKILDEDAFGSDDDTALATQQSIRAFVLANVGSPSGADTQLQFNDGGSFGADSNFTWDNTGKQLALGGVTATARLHVEGVGATSATFAMKLDNSASSPLVYVRNDGNVSIGTTVTDTRFTVKGSGNNNTTTTANFENSSGGDLLTIFDGGDMLIVPVPSAGNIVIGDTIDAVVGNTRLSIRTVFNTKNALELYRSLNTNGAGVVQNLAMNDSLNAKINLVSILGEMVDNTAGSVKGAFTIHTRNGASLVERARVDEEGNFGLGITTFGTNAAKVIGIANGVVPITSPANMFQMYSTDIVAGNAAPHFRTELGDVIKLFKGVALTAIDVTAIDAVYDATEQAVLDNIRTRLNELEARIQATGLLT